jgi:biopolymer transport protein ExbB/TolQ
LEIDITRRLAQLALATRVGPMLGLVGTLIPLGPALTGLATGHMEVLAGNLIIAFTTTVFGILIGGFAYAISLVRRTWYEQDLSDLEFLVAVNRAAQRQPDAPCLTEEPDLA